MSSTYTVFWLQMGLSKAQNTIIGITGRIKVGLKITFHFFIAP